jgi:protein SCO1/2
MNSFQRALIGEEGVNLRKLKLTSAIVLFVVSFVLVSASQTKSERYNLRGEVLGKDPAKNEITVKHSDIPGFMPAMTMPFNVKSPSVFQELQPGDKIAAEVVVAADGGDYWLENVRITDRSGRKAAKAPAPPHPIAVGESVPNLPLTNQDGKAFRLSDFKGKAVLLTFIYTRCPMPNFCPRLSSQFARIHNDLKKTPDDYRKTHLLSISFDPKYDTAPVLRKYGLAYLDNDPSGFAHWDFASTTPGDLRRLANAFGLEYIEEDKQISHTMNIVLIAPDGTVARYWSTAWTAAELEKALREQAAKVGTGSAKAPGRKGRP